jgi:hypothetical protein
MVWNDRGRRPLDSRSVEAKLVVKRTGDLLEVAFARAGGS